MCTNEMIWYLSEFVELLEKLHQSHDPNILALLSMVDEDARYYLRIEKDECLDTDPLLRNLEHVFRNARAATQACVVQTNWDGLTTIATELTVVRDALDQRRKKVPHETTPTPH